MGREPPGAEHAKLRLGFAGASDPEVHPGGGLGKLGLGQRIHRRIIRKTDELFSPHRPLPEIEQARPVGGMNDPRRGRRSGNDMPFHGLASDPQVFIERPGDFLAAGEMDMPQRAHWLMRDWMIWR